MYVEWHAALSQTLSIMTKDSWPGRITGNARKTQFPHLPWMKNSIFQSLLRVHQTPQGVMRSLEKSMIQNYRWFFGCFFFLSPYVIYSEISKNIKRGHKIVRQEGVQVWKTETSHKCVCFCRGHAPHSLVSPKRMQKGWAGVSFPRRSPCEGNK